jgi:hypothetical protein
MMEEIATMLLIKWDKSIIGQDEGNSGDSDIKKRRILTNSIECLQKFSSIF